MNQFSVKAPAGYEDGYAPQEPLLARDSFRYAKQQRSIGCEESSLVLTNCRVLNTRTGESSSYGHSVVVHNGRIQAVDAQIPPEGAVVINCHGMLLMPGRRFFTCILRIQLRAPHPLAVVVALAASQLEPPAVNNLCTAVAAGWAVMASCLYHHLSKPPNRTPSLPI